MAKKLIIVAAQINSVVGDLDGNAQRIIAATQKAREKFSADLVVFPELALSGYPPEDLLFRPGFYTRCRQALQTVIDNSKDIAIVLGYPDKVDNQLFNKAALIQNSKLVTTYAKQCLPNYTVFDEKRYFTPGNQHCLFHINGVKIAVIICEDTWFAEPAKQAKNAHADVIVSINASPYDRTKVLARETMLKKRVKETGLPIIYCNCVGGQDELVFDGGSMVVNAQGERCQQAAYYQEDLMAVTVNNHPVSIEKQPLPKPLTAIENVYKTLVLGVRDYIQKNQFPGAIVGLSGGIDSALTLAIACDAIGSDKVRAVMMPSRFTADMSTDDAKQEADTLGVKYDVIAIKDMFNAFLQNLEKPFAGAAIDKTEENLQARIRGTLLMALSNKTGSIVLTTGNKSEMSVGYATLYGDMAGGFAVLKDVPKTLVYELADYRNQLSSVIPQRVIERAPSAELSENQTDQDSLPPYDVLDDIIERYVDRDEAPETIYAAGFDKDTVNHVIRLINRNEYKRRQAPIGTRLSQRAFGKDRRYPITSGYLRDL